MNSQFLIRESFQSPAEHIIFYTGREALGPSRLPSGLPQLDRWVDRSTMSSTPHPEVLSDALSVLLGLSQDGALVRDPSCKIRKELALLS